MRLCIIPLLIAAGTAAAAVDLDLDLAALRPQAAAMRALMPEALRQRLDAGAAGIAAETGRDPRATATRLHLSLDDAGRAGAVVVGVPAEPLARRIAARRPQASPVALADDVLAVGLAGAPAPTAVPPAGSAAISLHATPAPSPRLPIMRLLSAIDAHSDGDGRIRATLTAHGADAAEQVEARLLQLRSGPAAHLPLVGAAVAGMGVQRYGSVVHVAIDLTPEDRAQLLQLALERIAERMPQEP